LVGNGDRFLARNAHDGDGAFAERSRNGGYCFARISFDAAMHRRFWSSVPTEIRTQAARLYPLSARTMIRRSSSARKILVPSPTFTSTKFATLGTKRSPSAVNSFCR